MKHYGPFRGRPRWPPNRCLPPRRWARRRYLLSADAPPVLPLPLLRHFFSCRIFHTFSGVMGMSMCLIITPGAILHLPDGRYGILWLGTGNGRRWRREIDDDRLNDTHADQDRGDDYGDESRGGIVEQHPGAANLHVQLCRIRDPHHE